jgi:transposase
MTRVRYSDAFKRQIVDEVESGRHGSLNGVAQAYGIGGMSTIVRWVRQYGREDLLPKNVRVETLKERDKLKEARKRIRELEAAVADAHMDYCLERGFLRVACERLGEEPEVFKKKHAMTLSDMRKPRKVR